MQTIIREPRWTRPALVLAGRSFRLVCENAPPTPMEARLEKHGRGIALASGDEAPSAGGRYVVLDCTAPDDAPEGLYDLKVAAGGCSAVAPNAVCVLRRFSDPFTFLHISDLHMIAKGPDGGPEDGSPAAEKLVEEINSLAPEFVVDTGDLISRYGKNPGDIIPPEKVLWQIERAREIMLRLRVPVFVTPGNHDTAFSWCREGWGRHMGAPWARETDDCSFDYGPYHFTVLDASAEYDERTLEATRKGFSEEQLAWLAKDLTRASSASLRFLFYHYDYDRQLLPLLVEHDVNMVFYGHSGAVRYERQPPPPFADGHLDGRRAYQAVRVSDSALAVEKGPLLEDLK